MTDYFLLDPDYKDFDFPDSYKLKFLTVYGEQHTFIVLAVIMSIVLPFIIYTMIRDVLLPDVAYLTLGATAEAIVTNTCESSRNSFTYTFEGIDALRNMQRYEGQDYATSSNPCPQIGDHIKVFYIQGHPQTSQRSEGVGKTFLIICFMVIEVAFLSIWLRKNVQHIRAFINARPRYIRLKEARNIFNGVLSYAKEAPTDKFAGRWEGYYIEVTYDFIAYDLFFRGKQVKRRNDLRGKPLPPPGTPVRILYADENTYIML